ncbi:MAG TPA: type II secretion system protein N [Usitatibacter sp.]|nr:type II secretion system protein N [Usitatibacter sp.]
MRSRTLVALVGIPGFAIFMVVTAPASFLASRAAEESGGRVHFDETRGTLWAGSVRAQVDAPGGAFTADRIAWRLLPARLVEGRVAFEASMESRGAIGSVEVLRGWSEWEARRGSARVEAKLVPVLAPIVAAWRPEGAVSITADGVRWNDREMNGPLTVEWRDAAVALSDVKPLGSYRLSMQGVGETAKLALSTLSGAMQVSGTGEWKLPRSASFTGEARGEGPSAAALDPLLNLMGPRRADGARSIEVRIR